ncbi:hypothetical protein [Rhodococcus sp. IEGM 1330]|uniref:hypothetical protein n=1 Tax=Rhodococcus sp. IEGM 1330 TaxID=3082225 RepID=UPI002955C23B|nr:hypothetical protein [Rhodococcus sp. IEGM 1330]MDV8024773.1 hypothetical protein [Rhodococcus sp. IEGM 1330]
MAIALGVHVGDDEISAALVEADLPELGPVAARTVSISAVPGGIGDAVTTVLGIMRVQAAQNDLLITGSAVVCDTLLQCDIVRAALLNHQVGDVEVLDVGDPRVDADYSLDIAAALIGTAAAPTAWTGEPVAVPAGTGDEDRSGSDSDVAGTPRSARLAMIGLGVAVLAALSGATVWALAAADPTQNPVVDTADIAEKPSSGDGEAASSSVAVVADSAAPPPGPSAVPSVEAGLFVAPVYGPVSVGTWSEALPEGAVATPYGEVSSGGDNSGSVGSGGGRPGVVTGGGGNAGSGESDGDAGGGNSGGGGSGGGDSGGEETPTVDPSPEPEPEPEVPSTDPSEPTTEVPETTEPTTDAEPPADPVE